MARCAAGARSRYMSPYRPVAQADKKPRAREDTATSWLLGAGRGVAVGWTMSAAGGGAGAGCKAGRSTNDHTAQPLATSTSAARSPLIQVQDTRVEALGCRV